MKYFIAFVVGSLIASSSFAESRIYNSSLCVKTSGGGTLDHEWSGRVRNTSSTSTVEVNCPAVVVTEKGTSSAWISVVDPSSSDDVSCHMLSHYNTGAGGYGGFFASAKTSGFNSNWQRLTFDGFSDSAVSWNSNFTIGCTLPARSGSNGYSRLGTYKVYELN